MKLVYENSGEIGSITLSNPPQNTLITPDFEDVSKLEQYLDTPTLKAVIIKGEGRHFSAGADLDSLHEQSKSNLDKFDQRLLKGKQLLDCISSATIPVVAVIKGSCFGAGLEIALACHFRFASKNALLGFPESEQGLMPGLSGTIRALETIRSNKAIDLVLTGRMINGDEALKLGLVDHVGSSKNLEQDALEFIERLTGNRSAELVRSVMTSINNATSLPRHEALQAESELFISLVRAKNHESGTSK